MQDIWDDATDITGQNQNGLGPPYHATEELQKCCRPITGASISKAPSSSDAWITKASSSTDEWITKALSSTDAWITKESSSNAPPFDVKK